MRRRNNLPILFSAALNPFLWTALLGCKGAPPAVVSPPPPVVTVSQPVEREIVDYDEYTGRTAAVQEVEVRARVRGYLAKVYFTDGAEVKKGELLFQIDLRPFQAEFDAAKGKVAQWEAKLKRAEADVERTQRLLPKGAASQKDLDNAIADRGEALAAIQSARAEVDRAALDLEFAKITAPINGRISRPLITEGNLVNAGGGDANLLTTIVSLDPMYVYFDVDERAFLLYQQRRRGQQPRATTDRPGNLKEANIPVLVGLANEEGYPHQGVLDFAENKVDPNTGTIPARGVFANANRIFTPGLFVRVRIPVSDPYKAILVVDRAIGTDQGQKYMLVTNEQNVVEYRKVRLGALHDGLRVVREGLKPGESAITSGLQRARPGMTVNPQRTDMPSTPEAAGVKTLQILPAQPTASTAPPSGH